MVSSKEEHIVTRDKDLTLFASIVSRFAETLNPSTATMKRLFTTIKRKKSPKSPQQLTPPAKSVDFAAGPPDSRTELDVIPDGRSLSYDSEGPEADRTDPMVPPYEGGREGSQLLVQDGMYGVRELQASGASISGVVIGGTGCRNQPEGEWFRFPR